MYRQIFLVEENIEAYRNKYKNKLGNGVLNVVS